MNSPLVFTRPPSNPYVWVIVRKTNLPFQTVRSLLIRGWKFEEGVDAPSRWVAPIVPAKEE